MASIAPNPDDNNACWVCLNGAGDKRSPLLRDCACHGSSGYAHLKCLTRSAINHTEAFLSKNEKPSGGSNHCSVGPHFGPRGCNPWSKCPLCKFPYEGESLQALACAMQQRYGKDLGIISDNGGSTCTLLRTDGKSQSHSKKGGAKSTFPIFFQKFALQTIANAKAKGSKRACKEEAIRLYQQVLEIERSEQESFAGRRCTALEKRIVSEEMMVMCCMGEIYADLGQCHNALSILEEALALAKSIGCLDEEALDGHAHALRIMSEIMLSNGNPNGAERRIQEAKGIWDSRSKQGALNHTLEYFQCLWQFGIVLMEVGDKEGGLAALTGTLVKAERELGSSHSLVRNWKQVVEKYGQSCP